MSLTVMDSSAITGSTITEPRVDLEFESHEAAYAFYKEYAKSVGFGTAKLSSRRSRATKEFIDAKFSCIRYGNKQQSDDAINPRPSPKIGCKASMHVKRRPNGKWYVYSFVKEHNHELLPGQAHFFRSHRDVDPLNSDARIRKRKNSTAVSKLFGAYHNIELLEGYMRTQHDKGRSLIIEPGDAQTLLELFVHMQEENPKFFYAVDMNEDHKLRNLFWVDAKGMEDYSNFHDVVCFDTTYFTSKYKIPLVLFIGVNHHVQPTLLGCGLIADDTVYTFVWLMETWFLAMGEIAPRVILTDQNNALKTAIAAIFPETRHCFCLWHVLEKIPQQLEYLSPWHDSFMEKFSKCIFRSWTEGQFEKRWWKLVEKFNLREVEWVQSLYEDRKYWVPTFLQDVSFAGLSTMLRSECVCSSFDKYIRWETTMREFVEQYKLILEDRYEEEAKSDFDTWHETPELKSPSPFEKQMSFVYTHEIFKKFQVEVLGAAACHLKKEETGDETAATYTVKDFEDNQQYIVEWNEPRSEICCSCRSFEYKGYLCRHAIVVLQMSGVFKIPSKYVLQRWTNAALSRHGISERLDEVQTKVKRCNDLCRRAIILGEEGSLSEESYNIALSAIKEALKQCVALNSPVENGVSVALVVAEEENQSGSSRAEAGKQKEISESVSFKKAKVPQLGAVSIGLPDNFQLMLSPPECHLSASKYQEKNDIFERSNQKEFDMWHLGGESNKQANERVLNVRGQQAICGTTLREMCDLGTTQPHNIAPVHLQNVMPTVFPNMSSSQFQNMAPSHLPR